MADAEHNQPEHNADAENNDLSVRIVKTNLGRLFFTFFAVAFILFLYELLKQFLFPNISIWRSHIITIIVGSIAATATTHFVLKTTQRLMLIQQQKAEVRKLLQREMEESLIRETNNSRILQRALAPPFLPPIKGISLATRYRIAYPHQEIGGDFYDVFHTENDNIGVLIGDVSGKGVNAAACGSITRAMTHAFAFCTSSPAAVLERTNRMLFAEQESELELFVTACFIKMDTRTGGIICCNAGHESPIIRRRDGSVQFLDGSNLPLGVGENTWYSETEQSLEPGDMLVLYTDGVTEARRGVEQFGQEGIVNVLKRSRFATTEEVADEILAASTDWSEGRIQDDVALVIISTELT